jgi:hypothetical protein
MKKLVTIVALGAILLGIAVPPADAHGGSAALALAAFAAFNVLFLPFALAASVIPPVAYPAPAPVAYSTPAAYTAPAPAYASAPAPRISREVVYAHGRYVLLGDGVSRAYQWVWVPNPPPPGSAPGY